MTIDRKVIESILTAGVLAPSADNQHRFRYVPTDDGVELVAVDGFFDPRIPHRRFLSLTGLGAVVENMVLRAGQLGLAATPEWFPRGNNEEVLVRLRLRSADGLVEDLAEQLGRRHTNRRMYRGPKLTAVELSALSSSAEESGNCGVLWLQGGSRRSALALIRLAESQRFAIEYLHAELFDSVAFEVGWSGAVDERLPPAALEVEAGARPVFKALRRWPLMQKMKLIGAHHMLGIRAGWLPAWQAPGLGVIVANVADDDLAAIEGGRAFERLWLRATALGLSLQPLAASTVLSRLGSYGGPGAEALAKRLRDGWRKLLPSSRPVVVFRVGRSGPASGRAGRPPLGQFLQS